MARATLDVGEVEPAAAAAGVVVAALAAAGCSTFSLERSAVIESALGVVAATAALTAVGVAAGAVVAALPALG